MKGPAIVLATLLVGGGVCAQELRHFNPDVLGRSIDDPVTLLLAGAPDAIEPLSVLTDVKDGRFIAATTLYPKELTLTQVRTSLNRLYGAHEVASFRDSPQIGLWRVENRKFAIQLSESAEVIRVIYIAFMPAEDVLQNIFDASLAEAKNNHHQEKEE